MRVWQGQALPHSAVHSTQEYGIIVSYQKFPHPTMHHTPEEQLKMLEVQPYGQTANTPLTDELKDSIRMQIEGSIALKLQNARYHKATDEYAEDGVSQGISLQHEKLKDIYNEIESTDNYIKEAQQKNAIYTENLTALYKEYETAEESTQEIKNELVRYRTDAPDTDAIEHLTDLLEETEGLTTLEKGILENLKNSLVVEQIASELHKKKEDLTHEVSRISSQINPNAQRARKILQSAPDYIDVIAQNTEFEAPLTDTKEVRSFVVDSSYNQERQKADALWTEHGKAEVEKSLQKLLTTFDALEEKALTSVDEAARTIEVFNTTLEEYTDLTKKKAPLFGKKAFQEKIRLAAENLLETYHSALTTIRIAQNAQNDIDSFHDNILVQEDTKRSPTLSFRVGSAEKYNLPTAVLALGGSDHEAAYDDKALRAQVESLRGSSNAYYEDTKKMAAEYAQHVAVSRKRGYRKINELNASMHPLPQEVHSQLR